MLNTQDTAGTAMSELSQCETRHHEWIMQRDNNRGFVNFNAEVSEASTPDNP